MNAVEKSLSALRRSLACPAPGGAAPAADRVSFGLRAIDAPLGGGLARAALHEIFAAEAADTASAAGFAVALALRAANRRRKLVWVRHELASLETGLVHAPGLAEFGADPDRFIHVRARDPLAALRAGNEAVRCAALLSLIYDRDRTDFTTNTLAYEFPAGHRKSRLP